MEAQGGFERAVAFQKNLENSFPPWTVSCVFSDFTNLPSLISAAKK